MNFENKTAVITGGSRGIGLAIAKKLAEGGANIAILYVGDEAEGKNAVEELSSYGTKVAQYFCNVADFEGSKKVVDTVIEDFGGIDFLINNAGITRDKLVLNMDESDFDAVIGVNLKGTFNMIKHTYKHFMKKRAGRGSGKLRRLKGGHHRADQVRSQRACRQGRHRQRGRARLHRHRHDQRPSRKGQGSHEGADTSKAHRHPRGRRQRGRLFVQRRSRLCNRRGHPRRRRTGDLIIMHR